MGRGTILAFLFSVLLWGGLESDAIAKAKWMPSHRQIAAADRASDCSVYQAIKNRFQENLNEIKNDIAQENSDLKLLFADLERCANQNGLPLDTDDWDKESAVAFTCEAEYQNWIQRSYRVLMLEDERATTRSKRDEADRQLDQCPARPVTSNMVKKASLGDLY